MNSKYDNPKSEKKLQFYFLRNILQKMRFFSLLLILTFAFPLCFCTKPIEELLKECEALYNSEEFKQMQENLRDQFDNDPLEVLEGIKAAGGLDKFIHPIKSVGEGGSNNEHEQHKFVINKVEKTIKLSFYIFINFFNPNFV